MSLLAEIWLEDFFNTDARCGFENNCVDGMMESQISSGLSEVRNIIRYAKQFVVDGLLPVV